MPEREMRVLLVDDQAAFLRRARDVLGRSEDFHVVGEAADGAEAVRLADELRPELVVMDVQMPRMNGITAAARIVKRHPGTRVVLISAYDEQEYWRLAEGVGAVGYLSKWRFDVAALNQVLGGGG